MRLYIDPGTGSMLFTILVGLLGTGVFAFRKLFIKLRFYFSGGKQKTRRWRASSNLRAPKPEPGQSSTLWGIQRRQSPETRVYSMERKFPSMLLWKRASPWLWA